MADGGGVLGALVGVGFVMAAGAVAEQRGDGFAQRGAPTAAVSAAAGSELIVVPTALGDKGQMLTVVDPPVATMTVPVAVFQTMRGRLPAALVGACRRHDSRTTTMPKCRNCDYDDLVLVLRWTK